jgi:hypothetical protein
MLYILFSHVISTVFVVSKRLNSTVPCSNSWKCSFFGSLEDLWVMFAFIALFCCSTFKGLLPQYSSFLLHCSYEGCPESSGPYLFFSKYFFLDHEKLHIMKSDDLTPNLLFYKVSVHFCGLVPARNKCMYAWSVPCLHLLTYPGSHCMNHIVITLRLDTLDCSLHSSKLVEV